MTIRLQTLQCGECGSTALERTGPNTYRCSHCGSVSLVEDDVAERLDRMLDQIQQAATARIAADQQARSRRLRRGIAAGALVLAAVLAATAVVLGVQTARQGSAGPNPALQPRAIPTEKLRISEPREVLTGTGATARPRLLVTVRNDTGQALEDAALEAVFQDAAGVRLPATGGTVPIRLLPPGESAPVLVDVPAGDRPAVRQAIAPRMLRVPYRATDGTALRFDRVRLVQEGPALRLVGRIVNPRRDATLTALDVLAVVYDARGEVAGFGHAGVVPVDLPPGGAVLVNLPVERWGRGGTPVAAWDYRIGYHLADADRGRTAIVSADRVVRTAAGPETVDPALRMTAEDLLATDDQRFDRRQFVLAPLVPAFTRTRDRVYLTEMVNRSSDTIAVAPVAVVERFDAGRPLSAVSLRGPALLYPGERFPLRIEGERNGPIDDVRVTWKPSRRLALPGPRPPLEIAVTGTRAETGRVLLNFSQRFVFQAVAVSGTIRNPGDRVVRAPQVWVRLRDGAGQLTGFARVAGLTALAPGDSQPFSVEVEQQGPPFATVETHYDIGP
ncbi:FxLYD domain-containing protein [uncultured Xylophilus sp.]|uniref:FxLYD domain-containing protein n=1 Tax=uncultured Xylophilus sp. TaxID=296832 RepID=UPI0025DD83D3|nr:FxLYD domain-containing protein [uncultured Xylophilus sp.]